MKLDITKMRCPECKEDKTFTFSHGGNPSENCDECNSKKD